MSSMSMVCLVWFVWLPSVKLKNNVQRRPLPAKYSERSHLGFILVRFSSADLFPEAGPCQFPVLRQVRLDPLQSPREVVCWTRSRIVFKAPSVSLALWFRLLDRSVPKRKRKKNKNKNSTRCFHAFFFF